MGYLLITMLLKLATMLFASMVLVLMCSFTLKQFGVFRKSAHIVVGAAAGLLVFLYFNFDTLNGYVELTVGEKTLVNNGSLTPSGWLRVLRRSILGLAFGAAIGYMMSRSIKSKTP